MKGKVDAWYIYNEYERFIKEVDFYFNEYKNKISNLYDEPDKEADKYLEYLYEHPEEYSYVENIENVETEIWELTRKRYELIRNIKYRNLLSYIMTLYQMIEQFWVALVKRQFKTASVDKHYIMNFKKLKLKTDNEDLYISDIERFYLLYNINLKNIEEYKKITELRILDNVIKHGNGKSAKQLKEIRPDYFEKSKIKLYNETIINDNMNIQEKDFDEYVKAIKVVLSKLPKKMEYKYEVEE